MSSSSSAPATSAPAPDSEQAPFHVLMTSERTLQEMAVRDERLKKDFLARRFRSLHPQEEEKDLWSAATPLERALAECCQVENDEEVRGALLKGKEGVFLRLVALHCHSAVTRALALAVLERTIQQDELDREEEKEREEEKRVKKEEGDDDKGVKDKEPRLKQEEEDDDDGDKKPAAKVKKDEDDDKASEDVKVGDDNVDIGRMGRFLQLGGLRILNQWLLDAMTPIKTVIVSKDASASKQKKGVVQTSASPTGPLLLPLLSVLTEMPFDKNLVTTVKINKQIRNLKKQLKEASRNVKGESRDPLAGGLPVTEVQQAVEKLMKRWEEQIKTSSFVTEDPFTALREQMRERLEVLKQYEAGETPKPEWLEAFEEAERQVKEAEEVSKLTVEQRAARERKQEAEQLLKNSEKAKEKREQLLKKKREESQKRKAETNAGGERKRTRRIRWKDGFDNSDNLKRRNLLETVHVYPSQSSVVDESEEQSDMESFKQEAAAVPVKEEQDNKDDA